jgi:hypothetical protein
VFKFLRKYNKWILSVGGTLLLITFLIPFAFTRLGDMAARTGATWATVGVPERRKVTSGELAQLQSELRLMDTIQQAQGGRLLIPLLEKVDQPAHWYLLVREAEAAGLVGGGGVLAQDEQVRQLAAVTGQSAGFVGQTLAKVQGVARLLDLYLDGNKLSDRRLKLEARRLFHRVDADLVVIEASQPVSGRTFSKQELREQMEQFADVAPGEGERGFGYRLPDRVRLEWLAIPADAVRDAIAASDQLDPVALRKHWYDNTTTFGPVEPTAAVPDDVRSDLLEKLTARRLREIAKYANDKLRIHRRGLPQSDGYYELPEGWSDLDFPALALELQQEFEIPLPPYHSNGASWLGEGDLAALEGIGTATTDKFGREEVALPALVMALREFGGEQTTPMQVGVSGPPLTGADESIFLFRVLEADPARPPRDLDEVRDEVVADLERLAHYDELVGDLETIRRSAIDDGLLSVALSRTTEVRRASIAITELASLFSPTGFGAGTPQPTALPVIGPDKPTVTAIIDRAMAIAPETPMSEVAEEDRTFVLPVESTLAVLIVRLERQSPLTNEQFAQFFGWGVIQRPLQAESMGDADELAKVFGFDALAARYQFELASGATSEEEDGEL